MIVAIGASPTTPISIILWGHILHSSIFVLYHGWRISHRTHHENHGRVENDKSWVLLPEKIYMKLDLSSKFMRYKIPFPLFAYPMYLWYRSPGKKGLHFNPYSELLKTVVANGYASADDAVPHPGNGSRKRKRGQISDHFSVQLSLIE
ncbi:Microsomal omega-3 fatty acid desaturase [Forsythia ovata]|uniref:Microsomal omega-3 fatty acid desaturase n=1 Tax=Forsythia ovata TaxID=205694 RepID=A0ABD1VGP0_9LAMI